jgi:hypothetical protein
VACRGEVRGGELRSQTFNIASTNIIGVLRVEDFFVARLSSSGLRLCLGCLLMLCRRVRFPGLLETPAAPRGEEGGEEGSSPLRTEQCLVERDIGLLTDRASEGRATTGEP